MVMTLPTATVMSQAEDTTDFIDCGAWHDAKQNETSRQDSRRAPGLGSGGGEGARLRGS